MKSSIVMSIIGEEEECVAEGVFRWCFVGCIGIYRDLRWGNKGG